MKQHHFIYKSDGLYYIPNMPDSSQYYSTETYPGDTFDQDSYNEALERAKEEAVLVTYPYVYQIAMHRYFPHFIDYSKTPQDNFAMCASIGQVYLLNMEEEIEVVEEDTVEDGGGCYVAGSRRFARIAAPKKHPDHECTMYLMTDVCVYSCKCDKPKTYSPDPEPKKEEETQEHILSELLDEFHSWCIGISFDPEGNDNRTRDEFIKDKLKAIEIKPKEKRCSDCIINADGSRACYVKM